MLPYKTILKIDPESRAPKYLQITNEFIKNISAGIIAPGQKLPGSRHLSEILQVNRRTVIAAFDELSAQGWISINPNQGCFVKEKLPETKPHKIATTIPKEKERLNFSLRSKANNTPEKSFDFLINDGYPDVRLAPLKELSKNFSYIMNSSMSAQLMTYKQKILGDEILRIELAKYLAETRSIHVDIDNIMTTRGSLMAFYVLFKTILTAKENNVIVGYPGFNEGHEAIRLAGGQLNYVDVDEQGMSIDQVESLCKKKTIKALFIVPHHHYPTTVSLSAERRMELLKLADNYQFAIIEDDYDYDFHYASAPILPIASIDNQGSVAYVGSFSKTIAPSLRLGFIVAPKQLITATSQVSKYIDSYGNIALERSVAMLFKEGLVRRHLRKALKTYRERRNLFCDLLESNFSNELIFNKPEGGLAIWSKIPDELSLEKLIEAGRQNGLKIPDESGFNSAPYVSNHLRIGFASMNEKEMNDLMSRLAKSFKALKS